jgi:hypothetical protein
MARRSTIPTSARSSIISPRPTDVSALRRLANVVCSAANALRRFPFNKTGAVVFCRRLPRKIVAKPAKSANASPYRWFSAEIAMMFKLSSLPHTAYRAPVGHGRFAGTGSSLSLLILRRRRDG